jgi:adenylate cyclase
VRRRWLPIALSLLVAAGFLLNVAGVLDWQLLQRLENIAYDTRLQLTAPRGVDHKVVILDIDERSLAAEGRWPWPRNRLAQLVDLLFDRYHIRLLGFDMVFAERDESSGLGVLERLAQGPLRAEPGFAAQLAKLRPSLDHDHLFAESLRGRPVILGYYFNAAGDFGAANNPVGGQRLAAGSGVLPPPAFVRGGFPPGVHGLLANGYGANLPELQQAALGAGHFLAWPDELDGTVRRVPMLMEYQGALYESLSIAMLRALVGAPRVELGFEAQTGTQVGYSYPEWLTVGPYRIPVDERITTLIPYRGPQGSFPYIPVTDVLHENVDPALLKGAIALLGTSAPGLFDVRSTPVGSAYPGVEAHANMIAGVLDGAVNEVPAYTRGAEFLLLLIIGIFMAFLLPLLSPLWAGLATALLLIGVTALNMGLWSVHLVLPLASSLTLILTLFVVNMSYGYFFEQRSKRQISGMFGQYVPPELVKEISANPERITLASVSREMTVLFADVRGFTTIAESLEPVQLSQLMNEFLTPMTRIIHRNRGTIDKYMGDAIMAFWGAPLPDPDHAAHALGAAMSMVEEIIQLGAQFRAKGWPDIRIGVGLNTGTMRVGDMGSEFRRAYTVLGDAVNLGSRLEALTRQYGVDLIVSDFTRAAVTGIVFRELDRVRVKGKEQPVAIYEPVGKEGEMDKALASEIALYQKALRLYRRQDWDLAEVQFLNLQRQAPQRRLYALYVERIGYFRANPPGEDWDGVFTFRTK